MSDRFLGNWRVLAPLSVLLLAAALYAQTLSYEYVWDDTLLFVDRTGLVNEPLSWALLSEPVLPGTTYFRPLMFLTMFIEFNVVGQEPMLSHAVNVSIFLINTLLVYLLALRLVRVMALPNAVFRAWLAALLYVVHPALVESVTWVSGRFDLMVTMFMLLGLYVALLEIRPASKVVLVCLAMMAGLLSKELAVVMPALLVCLWLACYGRQYSSPFVAMQQALVKNGLLLGGMLLTFALYMLLRIDAVDAVYHARITGTYIEIAWGEERLPLEALKFYLGRTFLPFHGASLMHPIEHIDFDAIAGRVGAWLAGVSVLMLFAWAFIRRTAAGWLMIAWLACITPVLHIVPLTILENIGHDRFLASALAFAVLVVAVLPYDRALAFLQDRSRRLVLGVVATVWVGFALLTTLSVIPMWANELRLWHWAYQDHSDVGIVRYNHLNSALQMGRHDLFLKEIDRLVEAYGGLEVGEQLLYANYLTRTGDPEGKKYTEGVLYALPPFHNMPDGRYYADRFYLTSTQMGGAYLDYASALMVFDGDAEQALQYNKTGEWYMRESEKIPLLYQRAAILYALNDFDGAEALLDRLDGQYYYYKKFQEKIVMQYLEKYCEVHDYKTESCQRALARDMVEIEPEK